MHGRAWQQQSMLEAEKAQQRQHCSMPLMSAHQARPCTMDADDNALKCEER